MEEREQYRPGNTESRSSKMWSDAGQQIKEATEPLQQKARDIAEEQKSAGVRQMDGLGRSVHAAAQELEKELPQTASYVHAAADKLQGASSYLRDQSVEDLINRFSRFARNQPAAAFAGSLLAGFALSRFLKSSSIARDKKHGTQT